MSSSVPDFPDRLVQHFGRDGMRRFAPAELLDSRFPEESRRLLESTGVPVAVAPHFRSTAVTEPVALDTASVRLSLPRPPQELGRRPLVGWDGPAGLCVRPDGALQAVVLEDELEVQVKANINDSDPIPFAHEDSEWAHIVDGVIEGSRSVSSSLSARCCDRVVEDAFLLPGRQFSSAVSEGDSRACRAGSAMGKIALQS